jgi:hypothetical protein
MSVLLYPNLGPPAYVPDSVGAVYTNPAATTTYLNAILVHNTDTAVRTIIIYEVPHNGGAVGGMAPQEEFLKYALQPGATEVFEIKGHGMTLEDENDTVQAIADAASKVTIKFFGYKYA